MWPTLGSMAHIIISNGLAPNYETTMESDEADG